MKSSPLSIAAVAAIALMTGLPGNAQAQLSKDAADQKFTQMVVDHLGKKSRGGATCRRSRADFHRCTGRWQKSVKTGSGARIKLIIRARGSVFENAEMIRSRAQLTKWKVVRGVKKGPFKGAFLMSTRYKPTG